MADSFSVSKDSIQIPYSRFLADSAAGLMAILFLATAYYLPVITKTSLRELMATKNVTIEMGDEVRVFILVALFILATPIGFAINAFSWMTLGQLVAGIESLCFRMTAGGRAWFFPVWYVSTARHAEPLAGELGVTRSNFAPATWLLRQALENPWLIPFNRESQVRGLVILLRNGAFFTLVASLFALGAALPGHVYATTAFVLTILALLIFLVWRWMSSRTTRTWAALTALGLGVLHVLAWLNDPALAARASIFLTAFVILIAVAGTMAYYNCCTVILDAHFARAALEITTSANVPTLQIATSLIAEAVKKSQKKVG